MTAEPRRQPAEDVILHALADPGASPAARLAAHLAECTDAQAALVVDGSADATIAKMIAAGWTLRDGAEIAEGKRIRFLEAPPWDREQET